MKKYAGYVPFILLITSIILFSSFLKEKPSYLGIARTIGQPRTNAETKPLLPDSEGTRAIPEIAPIVSIAREDPEPAGTEVVAQPEKKPVKKVSVKQSVISIPAPEEPVISQADTAVLQPVSKPDTLSQETPAEPVQEQAPAKKKRKKFLFFK